MTVRCRGAAIDEGHAFRCTAVLLVGLVHGRPTRVSDYGVEVWQVRGEAFDYYAGMLRPQPQLRYSPMDDDGKGGAAFWLVALDGMGKPACVRHGSMNKVSPSPPGLWRCITTAGPKINGCRAACQENP